MKPTTMESEPVTRPKATSRRRRRTARVLLAVVCLVALVHALAAVLQPVWAGLYLAADYGMLGVHFLGANVVFYAGIAQALLALALWPIARSWGWLALASVALAVAEYEQFNAGIAGNLAVHIPLGVAVVAGASVTAVLAWKDLLGGGAAR